MLVEKIIYLVMHTCSNRDNNSNIPRDFVLILSSLATWKS